MSQPIRKNVATKKKTKNTKSIKRVHPKYGTSKLEDRFAKEFLDRMGVEYVRQYEAKEIGRFYDFYIPSARCILEIDGDFYHGYGLLHEQKNPMQKHNEWVDRQKDMWAASHGIALLRIWEHDINDHPEKVRKMLKEYIGEQTEKKIKMDNKNKRH